MPNRLKQLWNKVCPLGKIIEDTFPLTVLIGLISKAVNRFAPECIKTRWSELGRNKRYLLVALLLGTSSLLILSCTPLNLWMQERVEKVQDWVIAMDFGTHGDSGEASGRPEYLYAFVDMDEKTYRSWGEPFLTPRDKLACLIKTVAAAQPSMVIVDVDLARSNQDAPERDGELQKTLAELPAGPPVILVKSLRPNTDPGKPPTVRQSFLDKTVAESDRLYWGFPIFLRDNSHSIRRWKIAVCAAQDNKTVLLPSVQLLAYALQSRGSDGNLLREMKAQLQDAEGFCSSPGGDRRNSLVMGEQVFSLDEDGQENRIFYSMKPGVAPPQINDGTQARPLLVTLPARSLFSGNVQPALNGMLHGRIVIIGASFAESFDIHETPLGPLPGSVIILNSLRSLFTYGVQHSLPWPVRVLFCMGLIILTACCFLYLNHLWGEILSWLFAIMGLPLVFLAYRQGYFFDFVIFLATIPIFKIMRKIAEKENAHHNPNKGQ